MSTEKLRAEDQLRSKFASAFLESDRFRLATLMARAISVYVDKAIAMDKSPPRDPNDIDMGR